MEVSSSVNPASWPMFVRFFCSSVVVTFRTSCYWTLTVTVLLVQPEDVKLTLPADFLTVTVKEVLDDPLTVCEPGVTWICPPLLDVAVIVPCPDAFVRLTLIVPEPLLTTFNGSGLALKVHGTGVGVGFGDAVPVG